MIRLYRTAQHIVVEHQQQFYYYPHQDWDRLVNEPFLHNHLLDFTKSAKAINADTWLGSKTKLMAPINSQEVWASGVTYLRSRDARMEESEHAKSAYDLVYDADRPELFFKSLAHRVAGPGEHVNIRKDSTWNVPEPEVTLFVNNQGQIAGYTIGNDMSSRSIEGENTLYLPQAKTYERSAAIGPCLMISPDPLPPSTGIELKIFRENSCVYHGQTTVSTMKRNFTELKEYLLRGLIFEKGCYLMTGTGIVPPSSFTLESGDIVTIQIDGIGELENVVRWF